MPSISRSKENLPFAPEYSNTIANFRVADGPSISKSIERMKKIIEENERIEKDFKEKFNTE
ncbi:MAG: hypothetical protein Q7K54_02425 [Candidatus Parcubacteria bacterium]|nr:hypothetical protein [Candidatus Parcubacteria bacterium]